MAECRGTISSHCNCSGLKSLFVHSLLEEGFLVVEAAYGISWYRQARDRTDCGVYKGSLCGAEGHLYIYPPPHSYLHSATNLSGYHLCIKLSSIRVIIKISGLIDRKKTELQMQTLSPTRLDWGFQLDALSKVNIAYAGSQVPALTLDLSSPRRESKATHFQTKYEMIDSLQMTGFFIWDILRHHKNCSN